MNLRPGASPGLDLFALRSPAAHPQTAMIVTETEVLAFSTGGIAVLHPHYLCFNHRISGLSFKKEVICFGNDY